MDILALRGLVVASNFSAFSVPATVTRPFPDDTPIMTTAIWCTPGNSTQVFMDSGPASFDMQRREKHRVVALMVADVQTVPRGTRIDAAESNGGPVQAWRVDGTEYADAFHRRLNVVPETEP